MDNGDGPKKWGFQGNAELNASSISVRGVLNRVYANLDKDDKRPTIPLGRADPTEFPSYQTTRLAPDAVANAAFSYNFNCYAPTGGIAETRRAVAEYLSKDFPYQLSLDDVYLAAGCTQAIEIVVSVLARPNANILLPRPGYPQYEARASVSNLEARHFDLIPEKGWELDGSDLGSKARWLGFWLGDFDLDLAWSDHGSMAQITTQWLRGSDLEMVLARDLSSVARWLGSISAHEDRIKQLSHKNLDSIEALADENTVAMVIINPSNPCGNVFTSQHLKKIAETARKLGIFVISDEVYSHLAFGSNPFVPMGVFGSIVPILTLGSISKRWIVPGWRLGWIVTCDPNGIFQQSGVGAVNRNDSWGCLTSSKASLHADQQSKPQPCSNLNVPPQIQCSTVSFSTREIQTISTA
uniref:Aminotransferase class I/classII large domain-containing protein n=1 Tax=Fagus sylvatica TaxID=28930 RepID=A0A2N9EUL7_FAGSY